MNFQHLTKGRPRENSSLRDVGVVAGPDTHRVMPGERKRPPNKSAKKSLAQHQRKNVAIASEQPTHHGSPDECKRHQHGVGPVQRSKQQATCESGHLAAPQSLQQAVHGYGLQSDLLQKAEGKVSSKALRLQEVSR